MRASSLILLSSLLALALTFRAFPGKAGDTVGLVPTDEHHIAEINSDQLYVAGYHVNTPDLSTLESPNATAITVSFPSTEPSHFPPDSWLGAGMFVQAQDYKLYNVDYAFYTMLVVDDSGDLFLDYGMHQTRESTSPLQWPTADLLYAYAWQLQGIDLSTPVTLAAAWDQDGFVYYSILTTEINVTFPPVNVADLPGCESIIRRFFAGTYNAGLAFPFGHYVHYFQFGIISPQLIPDSHWAARLKEPRVLRRSGWQLVDTAWSTQGDISYIDYDWKWGGEPHHGVSAQYYLNQLENPYELFFFYNGQTLPRGTVLWQNASTASKRAVNVPSALSGRPRGLEFVLTLIAEIAVLIGTATLTLKLRKPSISQTCSVSSFSHLTNA